MQTSFSYFLANQPHSPNEDLCVYNKFTGELAAKTALADKEILEQAMQACVAAQAPLRRLSAYERSEVLEYCAQQLQQRREEIAQWIVTEVGKPVVYARVEVSRAIQTFKIAAMEALQPMGEVVAMDTTPDTKGYTGLWKRFPLGPCAFITPFNFPLNLVAHKIAPAIAAGCPFILKPADLTPVSALIIGDILSTTSLPAGTFSILPLMVEDAAPLITDERMKLLSFTGSAAVGWQLKQQAWRKRVVLELGGNAACVVDKDADLDDVAQRLVKAAFGQSGESCISVQRVFIHRDIYVALRDKLLLLTGQLGVGDPTLPNTVVGPMVSEKEASRVEHWLQSAVMHGAQLLCGGQRQGMVITPAILESVPESEAIYAEEAFGPVMLLAAFDDFSEVLQRVNASRYGLQAGVFTRDRHHVQMAFETLEVGGVIIGDTPTFRLEQMPYGGIKDSGVGREGVRFAMQDMTEMRLLVVAGQPL